MITEEQRRTAADAFQTAAREFDFDFPART